MKLVTLTFVLLATLAAKALAKPEPDPAKASRYRATQVSKDYEDDAKDVKKSFLNGSSKKVNTSSGRLFMRKFFFKNMFGQNQNQPVLPIIITGGNADTDTVIDTVTDDTPTATGTVTDDIEPTPTETPELPETPTGDVVINPTEPANRIQLYGRDSMGENDKETFEDAAVVGEHNLPATLGAGAEEYIVTDQENRAKANRVPAHINLRLRGPKRSQVVSVRIPAEYSGYFRKGQRVILNQNGRTLPIKRRVIRRRKNRRRTNRNKKNKRRRIVVA